MTGESSTPTSRRTSLLTVREGSSQHRVFQLVGWGIFVFFLILVPIALTRGNLRPALRYWKWIAVYTTVEVALPWFLVGDAERRLSSSLTGLLIAATPFVGVVLGRLTGSAAAVLLSARRGGSELGQAVRLVQGIVRQVASGREGRGPELLEEVRGGVVVAGERQVRRKG